MIPIKLNIIPYILLAGWFLFVSYYLIRSLNKPQKINPYLLSAIPSVFATLGVLGTFLGIVVGLEKFDVQDIDAGIPTLLEGLKTAFYSSIAGIALSLIAARFVEPIIKKYNDSQIQPISGEEKAVYELTKAVVQLQKLLSSESDNSISTHLVKMRQTIRDEIRNVVHHITSLEKSMGGDDDTSLLSQTILFRNDNHEQLLRLKTSIDELKVSVNNPEYSQSQVRLLQNWKNEYNSIEAEKGEHYHLILNQIKNNNLFVQEELEKFAGLLSDFSTKALVDAIENVIGGFNERLNELLERLVKENFEQLNHSVQQLNDWQAENKEMVALLVNQFHQVANDFTVSSTAIKDISLLTNQLVEDEGRLSMLIQELEKVMTDETKFRDSIEQLHLVTSSYENSWDKAYKWMEQHRGFTDAIGTLIENLKEIEVLRNQTDGFFNDIKDQLSESVGIIKGGNEALQQEIDSLNETFYERLDQSFHSLDKIMQSVVIGYANRLKAVSNGK